MLPLPRLLKVSMHEEGECAMICMPSVLLNGGTLGVVQLPAAKSRVSDAQRIQQRLVASQKKRIRCARQEWPCAMRLYHATHTPLCGVRLCSACKELVSNLAQLQAEVRDSAVPAQQLANATSIDLTCLCVCVLYSLALRPPTL